MFKLKIMMITFYKAVRSLYTTMASGGRNSALSGLPVSDEGAAGVAVGTEDGADDVLGPGSKVALLLLPLLFLVIVLPDDEDEGIISSAPPRPTPCKSQSRLPLLRKPLRLMAIAAALSLRIRFRRFLVKFTC